MFLKSVIHTSIGNHANVCVCMSSQEVILRSHLLCFLRWGLLSIRRGSPTNLLAYSSLVLWLETYTPLLDFYICCTAQIQALESTSSAISPVLKSCLNWQNNLQSSEQFLRAPSLAIRFSGMKKAAPLFYTVLLQIKAPSNFVAHESEGLQNSKQYIFPH